MSIPPAPAINDAIGLLASLGDAEHAKRLLEELKSHKDAADQAFAHARDAQAATEAESQKHKAELAQIASARLALNQATQAHDNKKAQDEKRLMQATQAFEQSSDELRRRVELTDNREHNLDAREHALKLREDALLRNEVALKAREERVAETLSTLSPIAKKLGLG